MSEWVTISLLDPVRGDAMQSWEFENATRIRIGRAETNDVVLADTAVSRLHGELTRMATGWLVTALGRNGIVISGRAIAGATPVTDAAVMRLAAGGPYLEFRLGRRQHTSAKQWADRQRWVERERELLRTTQTETTDVDYLNRRNPPK
jgi:pSer/pThr/pTyr-binding forkhead associated (FHA) protein